MFERQESTPREALIRRTEVRRRLKEEKNRWIASRLTGKVGFAGVLFQLRNLMSACGAKGVVNRKAVAGKLSQTLALLDALWGGIGAGAAHWAGRGGSQSCNTYWRASSREDLAAQKPNVSWGRSETEDQTAGGLSTRTESVDKMRLGDLGRFSFLSHCDVMSTTWLARGSKKGKADRVKCVGRCLGIAATWGSGWKATMEGFGSKRGVASALCTLEYQVLLGAYVCVLELELERELERCWRGSGG